MGDSNRRRQAALKRGITKVYTLNLYDETHQLIVAVPMPILCQVRDLVTDFHATGMAGSIAWYLVNPTTEYWEKVEGAIAQYCAPLGVIPDFETLREYAAVLPVRFWANISRPDGALVQRRDTNKGPVGDAIFESKERVAPGWEAAESDWLSGATFKQMLRAS